jgi:hypothetical protein
VPKDVVVAVAVAVVGVSLLDWALLFVVMLMCCICCQEIARSLSGQVCDCHPTAAR